MEENLQQPLTSQSIQSDSVVEPLVIPQKQKSFFPHLLIVVILAISAGALYFYNQNKELKTQLSSAASPSPFIVVTDDSVDQFSNWKTYTNKKLEISFKLPESWANYSMSDFSILPFTGLEESLYLGPKNSVQKPPQLMQVSSYKASTYKEQEIYQAANCTITDIEVGIDKQIAKRKICKGMESNGYITIKTNQYVFIVDELKGSAEDHTLFNQILSTFNFSTVTSSETILETIKTLTKPMVWTAPVEGILMNAAGDEVPGTLISSKVATKEENKFAGLLVTDTPLVKQYGWAEDPRGMADGMGESISTYTKNNQKLIIRYKGGEYKVLLTK